MHRGDHQLMGGREEVPTNRDVDPAAEAVSPVSVSSDPISAENSEAIRFFQSVGNVGEAKKNAPQELGKSKVAAPPKATANIEIAHTAESPGIHEPGLVAESTHVSGQVSLQDQKPDYGVEGAASAVFAAAAVAGAEQEQEAPPRIDQEGGRASSVLSRILSAILRQLLPWVLPSALQGASAEDVKVNISKKQLTLSGVWLEPQELTALTGAPLHLLHCSIRELQLQVGGKEEAGDVVAASVASISASSRCSQTPADKICEGETVSPSARTASADGAVRRLGKEEASTIFFSAKDVILVLTPTSPHDWSRQQLLERALQRRRSLLYSMDNELHQQLERRSYFPLCLSSLISHWVDRNIQWACLNLNSLHLRIEFVVPPFDSSNTGSVAFALGLTLEELRIRNIPVEESNGPLTCATYECQQQRNNQEIMVAASTQTAEATSEPSPNSDPSGNCSSNRQGSVCSAFEIIGCSLYVQNELLFLAPHTCTATENIERLGAVRAEHKQDGHPKPEQATNEQGQPNQNYQSHRGCSVQTSYRKKPRCRTSKFVRSLLAPVGVHVLLRKTAIAARPSVKGDKRSSSMASWTGSSSSGNAATAVNTASSADPSYDAFVESDCVEVALTPEVIRGLRWLAANFEAHYKGVDAAEAVLSLVRPFVPSCTVRRNPRIWWRFAIRAICRLQRSRLCVLNTSSSSVAFSAQFDISGHGTTVEEILKLRLCSEKAATYRRLRLCQLEGTLTHEQLDQLIHLRDSLPLPLLLKSHGASRQDFMDQQSRTGGTGIPKTWAHWFTVWKRRSPQQGFTTETNTSSPGEAGAALRKSHFARPPVPPLSLQALLDRHNMDGQMHQLTPQNGEQHRRGQGDNRSTNPDGGKCLGGLDDFFDARSQPATARISSSRLRLHDGLGEGSTPALMYATLKEPKNQFQIPAHTPEEQYPLPPPLEMTASGDTYTGKVASQEGDVSGAPAPTRSNSDDNLGVADDLPGEDDTFYDCLDLQTPRCTMQACLHSGASGTSRMPINTVQNPVLFTGASEQVECTISVSIFLRSASFACCLDELNPANAESQPKRRGRLQKQQQGMQQAVGNSILCCIGDLRVSGVVGTEMFEGSFSVDRLDIKFKDGRLYRDQKVLMAPETGSGPLLSLRISQNPITAASAPIVNGKDRFPQRWEPSTTIRNRGGDERSEQSYIFLSLKVRRIICVVEPLVLKEILTLKNGFSNAAAAAVLAATKASQQCNLLHLGGCTGQGNQCSRNLNVGACGIESTYGNMHLQWRILRPSPRRRQQLRDGASLHYEVFVEAPTIIVPSSEGRAILCHLGELRVCSAHLEQDQLLCTQETGVKEPPRLRFADSVFQEKYMHILKARQLPAARKEVGGAARDSSDQPLLRHVSLRTHHGLLLKDLHLLIHNSMEQLKRELALHQCVGCGEPLSSSGFQSTHRLTHGEDIPYVRPLIQQQGQTRSANSCGVDKQGEGSAGDDLGYSATWGVCGIVQTVLSPAEFVAAVDVEQVGILSRKVALLPFKLAFHPEKWRRGRHGDFRETPVELLPSRAYAGKEAMQDPAKQEAPQSVRQPKKRLHQEQQRSKACDPWEQPLCEVQVHLSGKCSEVRASLSRHSCAAMLRWGKFLFRRSKDPYATGGLLPLGTRANGNSLDSAFFVCVLLHYLRGRSAFQSMKSAFLGNEVTTDLVGCPSFGRTFWTDAEGSSSLNEGCDDPQESEAEESSSIIPINIDLSLEWGKLGVYLHHLEDNIEGQKPADGRDASSSRVGKDTASATDSLQLQAAGVSAHFSSGNCEMVGRLELKQLLLEQPSLQEESINRYILCVPSTDLCSAAERIGAAFPGGPSIVLAFTSKPCNTRAPTTASVRILRPMTLNFRPTPVSWFVSFLGAPFERGVETGGRSTCSREGSCSDGRSSQSPHEAHSQRNTNNGRVRQFGEEVDATLGRICLSPEGGAAKPQPTKILSGPPDSGAHCDPVLRMILVEFQRVDFLWCTRGSNRPLATASVSAASASLNLCHYSTKFTGSLKDFTLHFVIPGVGSDMAAIPSSGCRWKHPGRFRRKQMPCDVPFEHCVDESRMPNRFPKPAILQVTEIIGLVPGRSYALRLTLESVHPLSPLFSGFSSSLKVDVGTCRVVYLHPKFWRLFDWMVDEFIGTLTSQLPAVSAPREMRSGNRSISEEALPKRIERSPSLEDLAVRSILQSAAAVGVGAPCSANSDKGEFMNEDVDTRVAQEQPLLVPNEGLRRIFLLADAGRSIVGLPPLLHESLQGPGGGMSKGENKLHRLVLPQTLPFSAFHYEIQITSPRLLLPASSRPNSRISLWPPVCCMKDLHGDHLVCNECCSTTNPFIGRDAAACTKCRDYLAASESSTQASGREVVCFLDCVTVSNSWNLSRGHGILESINVAFEGAKAFAKIGDFSHGLGKSSLSAPARPGDLHHRESYTASRREGRCRRCTGRVPASARSSIEEPSHRPCKSPTTTAAQYIEAAASPGYPGRYLLGKADLVIRMFRPVLLRSSSRWLRVEAGCVPLTLDVHTLELLFDIVENNITATDPDIVVQNEEAPLLTSTLTRHSRGRHALRAKQRAEGISISKSHARSPPCPPLAEASCGTAARTSEEDITGLIQQLLGNHTLQGLLEPQVDFIELLEEWGHETILVELAIEGLHLAVCEQQLKKQIVLMRKHCGALRHCIRAMECCQEVWPNDSNIGGCSVQEGGNQMLSVDGLKHRKPFLLFHALHLRVQLRSLRLQSEKAEQVGLFLPSATLPPPLTSLLAFGDEQRMMDKERTTLSPPVTGTFVRMIAGSSTLFAPELPPPFAVIFTTSGCAEGLSLQLEPLADSVRQAEHDAVAAATAIARMDGYLASKAEVASNSGQNEGENVEPMEKQLSGNSQQPLLQGEHLLVAPFSSPWIEPLQMQSQTQDSSSDEHELTSRGSVTTGSGGATEGGRFHRRRSGEFRMRSVSVDASSAPLFEIPPCSRDYEVIFRCGMQPRQEQRSARPRVPPQSFVPQPTKLSVMYKSATAVPVIPLSGECMLTVSKHCKATHGEKIQILQRLLLQRQHRRRQQRITVSSRRPRCVLSLPLLSRISAFLSNNEATSRGIPTAADVSGGSTLALMPHRESWQGMRRGDSVAISPHNRSTIRDKNRVTGEYTAEQANMTDSALGSRTCSITSAPDHTEMLGSGALSGGADPMHFGRRAVTLRRSSFDSAKLFSTGFSSRCSSEMLSATHAQDDPTGGNSHESGFETSSEPIESNEVDINDMLSLRLSCSSKEDTAAATQKREELMPLQLNSTELSVRFSEASVLLPVDSTNCESSSVLLRGSVNFCRRADDVRDPLRPHGISKDAQLAAGAYAHILSGYRKGKTQSFWVCGPSSSAASGEEVGTGILQEQESVWQDTTQFVEKLPDRFCPGARGVDILLQKAEVSCLHHRAPLHQHCASTGDVSGHRINSDVRIARRLRWTSRRSTCASVPARQSTRLKVEEATSKLFLPDELRCAAGKEETEAYLRRVRSDSPSSLHTAGASLHCAPVRSLGNFQCDGKVCGDAAPHNDCLKVTKSASSVAEIHSTPRSICSGLQAHISRVFISPAPRCHRQESDAAQIVSHAAQGGNGDAGGVTDDSQQQYSVGRAHESCCCCLVNGESSSSVGMGGGTSALACDCCCHHPQEYTSLQLSPCDVELSHLDIILIWRCAAEQTVQLEQQQRRHQAQVTGLQRLLHRSTILKKRLCVKQRLLQKQLMETAGHIPALPASVALKSPSAVYSASQRPVLGRVLFPTAAAASSPQREIGLPQTYPGQRYVSARLSLMRVTLLDDHLDCLKAPLLQLSVPNCRLSQASSLLPPQSTDTPRLFRQERSQKQQISSVSLLTASLRLWAFNPLTVAFEPVVESLPLSLVVREAPYSLMRFTYSSCCDDDSLALNVGRRVVGSRGELHKTWRSPPNPSTHGNDPRTLLEMASSLASTPNEKMSSSNDNASSSSTICGYYLAGPRSPLLSRKASAIVKQQPQGSRPSDPATTFQAKSSRTRPSLGAHTSGETALRNTQLPGNQSIFLDSGTEGATDALGYVECVSPGDEVSSSRRYIGISVSSTEGSSIEVNLSPLLLQSVVRTICKWHCEFTHQAQHQQQQRERKEYSSSIFRTAGAKLPQMCSQSPSQQQHQEPLQYQEEVTGPLTYVKSQCTGGQTEQPWRAQDGPVAGDQRLTAEASFLQKRPSRSLDAPPIPAYTLQGRHTERHHSLPAALPRGEIDWRFGTQLRQQERQSFLEADEPKRGKLFFAYHVVNQTGLYLGILLLPTQAAFGEHDEALCGANATQVAAAAQLGLPQTLRQCRRHNKNVGVYEEDDSSCDSRSSTSEAEAGHALASLPIYWDFGSNLPNVTRGSPGSVGAVMGTFSCPSSPSSDQDGKPVHCEALVDSSSWGWLQPSEERALTQMRVSIGTASSAHVALQLAKHPTRAIPWVKNTLCKTALQTEKWNNDETDFHEDGSCRRWKLRMPVPLDRVGVYIQPLEDVKKTAFSGATVSTSSAAEQKVPYVVCRLIADGGTKQLLVQSQVLLRSSCSVPLQARLLPSLESSGIGLEKNHRTFEDSEESEQLVDFLLKPGETSAVPVDCKAIRRLCPGICIAESSGEGKTCRMCFPSSYDVFVCLRRFCVVCFTGRLRIRPVHAGKAYSWSRDLSLDMLWRVVDGTEQEKNDGSGAGGEAGQAGSKRCLPKTGMLRCCPLINGSRSCPARDPMPTHGVSPKGSKWEGNRNLREPDYHIMVRYSLERLVHLSFSCIQLKVSFEAPLQLSSNIPFPVRYCISCPLVLRAGEVPPGDSEGVLQLNEWQQLHSFPLSGVAFLSIAIAEGRWTKRTQIHPRPIQRRRPPRASPQAAAAGPSAGLATPKGSAQAPADCVTGSGTEAGKRESAEDRMAGETIVEVECLDSQHRSAKVWLIFCEFGGGSPCLLLHSPVWLVSHIQWALQKQWLKQPQQQNQDRAETQGTELPAVKYSVIRRSNSSELGWAMQAVSAAAAAVDFNRHTEQLKPAQLPNFTGSSGVMKDPNEGIRLLDFTASSIRVEVDGIGCSQFLDVWGDFPRRLSVSASYTENVASGSKDRATVSECNVLRQACSVPVSTCEERPSPLGSAVGGPCMDIVATMSEAPFPLLRPVLLLTLSPVYTITSQCPFPIRVRQARSGSHCSNTRRTDAGSVDFTLHIQPQHTEAFVWQHKDGSRFLQLQGCRVSTPFDGGLREAVWSAWSGYSPFCLPGDDWCLRLPSAPSVAPRTNEDGPAPSVLPLLWGECEAENTGREHEQMLKREQFPIPAVEPQDLVRALLRRGVSVKNSGTQSDTKRQIRGRLARGAFSGSQCSALRLCSSEGPASSVNLTVQTETFDMRDTVSICNSTPLSLLLRQCHHGDTEGGTKTGPQTYQESAVAQKLGLKEAAAFGVDSVAAAVAELWGAATQAEGLQQHQTSLDTADSFGNHAACSMGGHSRSSQLLNMLLEAQQCGEKQSNTKRPPGASSFHSCEAVYISAAPHEEGIHAQLDRLARVAKAVVAQTAAEQQHPQNEVDDASVFSAGKHCCWCIFEHAVSEELCAMQGEATEGAESGEGDAATSKLSLLPQLVLPGETVLFTWDDYRYLPCIELTYFPWLQQNGEHSSSDFTKEPCTSNRDEAVPPVMEYPSFDMPFVVCIPLRPDVRGVVPLSPLPSSSWPIFRVVRRAGSLLLQIAPAGEILGLTSSSYHRVAQQNHEGTSCQLRTKNCRVSAGSNVVNARAGSFISPWADEDSDKVPASRSDVDARSLLTVPRYFELPMVNMDLTAVCSRCRETSSGCDGCVPPWSFASMCRFAGSIVGSYAPDPGGDPASARAFHPVTADASGGHVRNLVLPKQPTPDPPIFEFRIEVPRLQLSVLSQSAITDPLSRQTLRLPEELFLATLEGLSAAYICSLFHTAAACRVQELQIDSMHSHAYYPVLLQRAPPMPSETGAAIDSSTTEPSRITGSTHKNQGEGDGGRGGGSLHAAGRMSKDDGGALVEFLLQQRLPFYGTRDDGVVVIDKCSLSLEPVSIRTDLKSVYMASEAMSCWTSAWAASISSMNLLYPETTVSTPVSYHQIRPERPYTEILESSDWRRGRVLTDDEELEYHFDIRSGLSWACKGWNCRPSPISAFASQSAGTGSAIFPITLAVCPWLFKLTNYSLRLSTFNQKREQRYIFRMLTIASTCVVLSFKADTGGNSSALRRSVVTLSSLEDARLEVDGLQMTGQRLMGKVQELNHHQRPHMHQDCSRLTKLTRHHRHPTVSLRDVARVVGHFYQQQLLSHLSKLLVSVDLLGNPALSFAHLQAGVYALAKQPMAAAETGGDVFEGMMRGAEDFLKHTGYGVFGGISRMAGVASDSLGALACDEVYVHTRKQQGRHKARNVEEGLQQGVEALGRALAGGITGLVEEPVRGAAEGGFEGLLRGAGRGIAGFLVKPLTGVLDLAQKTAEAIKDASQVEGHQRPRLRLPRLLLGDLRLLVAYDAQAAEAKAILTDAEGQYWENLPVLFFALDHRLQALTVLTARSILLFTYYSRNHAELRFLAPVSCVLAVGHCSTPNRSTSSSRNRTLSTSSRHRHAVVLQLRQEGESRVYYQQLTYSNTRIQVHILNSLRQLLLQ